MIGELHTVAATISRETVHFRFIGGEEAINLRRDTPEYYRRIGEWFCRYFDAGQISPVKRESAFLDLSPDVVRDVLSLVMNRYPDIDTIVEWGPDDRESALKWASKLYLQASVSLPDKPVVLVEWETNLSVGAQR